jgi:micrococcal nuclease
MLVVILTFMTLMLNGEPSFTAKVVGVKDGDTIVVSRGRGYLLVRLEGIDCPELGQAFGRAAKRFASQIAYRKTVEVIGKELDSHGRLVARIRIADLDLSFELIRAGLAWHYKRYSSDQAFAKAEKEARLTGRGLWRQANPMPPWQWRHNHPRSHSNEQMSTGTRPGSRRRGRP